MTTSDTGANSGEYAIPSQWFHRRESIIAYALVLFAVAFNIYHLYPEVAGDVLAWNDTVFHLLTIEAAVEAINQGRNFTDPWQASMGMSFPLFHYYQHLPHVTIALFHVLNLGIFPLAVLLNWTNYLLLSLFPYRSTGHCGASGSISLPLRWAALSRRSWLPPASEA